MNIFQQYLKLGLSVLPCEMKRPVIGWKNLQSEFAPDKFAATWKTSQVAIVCGQISGGLICIDFDIKNGDKYNPWIMLINEQYPKLLSKLVIEKSPSGGYHVIFRSDYQIGNVKLAVNPEMKCTIETRGEGGYFVCAPSPGYTFEYQTFDDLQKITTEEAEILIQAAKSFNERIEEQTKYAEPPSNLTGLSPFDDYNQKHDVVSLLVKHGWKVLFCKNTTTFFQRPGKQDRSISATWGAIPERFYVFTTSTAFENMHIYKASAVFSMLECNGNYSEAAKLLYSQGFGERIKKQEPVFGSKEVKKYEVQLIKPERILSRINDIIKNGYPKGKTTGWQSLDNLFSVLKGQLTVITGMPSHGKSEFMDALAINLSIKNGWKFAVFSPENYPIEMHYHKLIEKITGFGLRDQNQEKDIELAINIISSRFFFIDALEEDIDLSAILGQTEILIKEKNIDALIIDPWNEIELSKPKDISDSDFVGVCLRKLRKFARKNNIHLFIIAHPTKMQKDKNGVYPIPELYDIMGSSHWRNKADNGICVHRDFETEQTEIHIQKVKFRYAGKQGIVNFKYDTKNGRYYEVDQYHNPVSCDRY
jgi:hypothetical protein